jgi:hypothetical protein
MTTEDLPLEELKRASEDQRAGATQDLSPRLEVANTPADNGGVTWKNKTIVLAAGAVSALVGLNVGSAATNDPWIVFAASPNHGTQAPQLFRVRASGSGLKQVTTGSHPANDAAFGADGRRVAFSPLSSGLFLINVDGSGLRRLTANGSDRYPVWSPNGRSLAFVRGAGSAIASGS